jgi:hypothetical protein
LLAAIWRVSRRLRNQKIRTKPQFPSDGYLEFSITDFGAPIMTYPQSAIEDPKMHIPQRFLCHERQKIFAAAAQEPHSTGLRKKPATHQHVAK